MDRCGETLFAELLNTTKTGKSAPNMPTRPRNQDVRPREHLTPAEVDRLIVAAGQVGRHRHRDKTAILLAYRHGLRVGELVSLRWSQVDLDGGLLHVTRLKGGVPSTHPLSGPETRALRRLRRDYPVGRYVLVTERGGPLTTSAARKIVSRAGRTAGFEYPIHPHQLRHACGYYLASQGHDTRAIQLYLGHRSIQHTTRYTDLAPGRFDGFWSD